MADLYATSDYREYLREVFEERKAANGLYSYRLWARQLGIDPSQLFRILSKDLQLPIRHVDAVIKNLKKSVTAGGGKLIDARPIPALLEDVFIALSEQANL